MSSGEEERKEGRRRGKKKQPLSSADSGQQFRYSKGTEPSHLQQESSAKARRKTDTFVACKFEFFTLKEEVQLCLDLTVTAQSSLSGQPGFFISARFYGQTVVTEPVLGQDLSLLWVSDGEETLRLCLGPDSSVI